MTGGWKNKAMEEKLKEWSLFNPEQIVLKSPQVSIRL
jgi:hypothetical protein